MSRDWVVTLPDAELLQAVGEVPDGVRLRLWDLQAPADDPAEIGVVVPPYMGSPSWGALLRALPNLRLVQLLTAGFESVLPSVPPGVALANAAGVHDASTAELAVGLAIASLRGLPDFVRDGESGHWSHSSDRVPRRALADRRVLLVGFGGVGRAVAARMAPFEIRLTAVASRARAADSADRGVGVEKVYGASDLPTLLPEHDVVVLTVPLTDATRHLADAGFLAAMPDGALLVNVARGGVVDTGALTAEVQRGRLLAALDVTDPEPLPPDHPLWRAAGALITPHVGGATSAFLPRAARMLRAQLESLSTGRTPRGIVVPGDFARP